ncbi:MAG: hypothetical protein AB1Z65_08905, partial [Candidatus Sulfomarinibacteraceae bacterium]
ELQLRPELDLDGTENLFVGPIMIEPREGESVQAVDLTAAREFEIYLRKMLRREARLNLLPSDEGLRPPSRNLAALADDASFWKAINEATGADLIVAAAIDVKVLDRSGYTTEEYVSPKDGQTYFRQVLVEETGFNYDVLLVVVDGTTAEVVHREQITDFKPRDERKLQEYTDMFSDLYTLQNRLLGIFVPRGVQVKRTLYND